MIQFTELSAQDIWSCQGTGQQSNNQPKIKYVEKSSQQLYPETKVNNFIDTLDYNEDFI